MPNFPLPLITLLLLTSWTGLVQAAAPPGQTQDPFQKVKAKLASESEAERCQAIIELSEINSEHSSRLLLKQLKKNLSARRGYYIKYDAESTSFGTVWSSTRSENGLLVTELGKRKYLPALPTFRKMLDLN